MTTRSVTCAGCQLTMEAADGPANCPICATPLSAEDHKRRQLRLGRWAVGGLLLGTAVAVLTPLLFARIVRPVREVPGRSPIAPGAVLEIDATVKPLPQEP